ncbi:MAG: ATP-binding protein, partial [Bacteroidota bacterium]
KTFVDFIQQASVRMTNFVSDILRYATADQAEQALTTVDCKEVLELIRLNIDAQLRETGGQLIVHDLPSIQAHSTLIMQVFQNLISNAIKFRKPEVAPIVSISGKQTADYVEFKIEDNGIGIKKEDQPRVFKLFQRLNSRTEYEGSGIGLSTVLKVLKKYNATIRLESEFGVGTSFYLKFPR